MCLIVDVNVAAEVFFFNADKEEYAPIRDGLFGGSRTNVSINYGGRLRREYAKSHKLQRVLLRLDQAGKATLHDDAAVDAEEQRLKSQGLCASDDEHIIALAKVGKVRLLCTNDQALREDFKNKDLLNKPRGKVYSKRDGEEQIVSHCR